MTEGMYVNYCRTVEAFDLETISPPEQYEEEISNLMISGISW
jgi:hypothetical protein